MIKHLIKTAAAVAAIAGTVGAVAAPFTLTNSNGSFPTWGAFDWASNGQIDGLMPVANTSNTFNATYYARAVALTQADGTLIPGALNNVEYSIFATLNGSYTCGTSVCTLGLTGGNWNIYYDTTPETGAVTPANTQDGTLFAQGNVDASNLAGNFRFDDNKGGLDFTGAVTYSNPAMVSPALGRTDFTSTLQLSQDKADGNQMFSGRVPEPASLSLIGFALAGLAGLRRRRKA